MLRFLRIFTLLLVVSVAHGSIEKTRALEGEWRLRLDPENTGIAEGWAERDLPVAAAGEVGVIQIPGTTDLAGAGMPNPKPPSFLGLQRVRVYSGAAWYQREIQIPERWRGARVTLFIERAQWQTHAWLDGHELGTRDSLVTPHEYALGENIAPGKHRLTVRVDNTVKFDLGRFASINYEYTQTNWNGLIGRVELRATEPTWIEDVQVFPRVAARSALVRGRIGGAAKLAAQPATISLSVRRADSAREGQAMSVPLREDGSFEADYALGEDAPLWDEFTPALHRATVRLANGEERTVTFGLREITTEGRQIKMNGRTLFLRGTADNATFPETGHTAMDVAWWKRTFTTVRSYGLNHFRFHSWTPPEAAFVAADELGLILQVEGPQANVTTGSVPARDAFIAEETRRILRAYGNHPSFCLYTPGNELRGKPEPLLQLVDECVKADPRRLYSSSTYGFGRGAFTENRQFTILSRARGIRGEGTETDHRRVIEGDTRPLISHEIGQWAMYPNLDEAKKYTGLLKAENYELVRRSLEEHGLLELAPRFFEATSRHSVLMYKEELEAVLRTPGSAGFQQLALEDYPGQGMALVGVLDGFFESKGLITTEAYRRFCDVTVPLVRLRSRTFFADEKLSAGVEIAHFGASDLETTGARWRLRDEGGREVAGGLLAVAGNQVPTGALTRIGTIEVNLDTLPSSEPGKFSLSVRLEQTEVENDWDLWVYPRAGTFSVKTPPPDVVVARGWNESTKAALAAGKTVLLLPSGNFAHARRGSFRPVFWSPVWFNAEPATMGILCDPAHPALAQFPTEFHSNWQWWDPLTRSTTFVLNALPAELVPIVRVIDNFSRNDRLGTIFEARVGSGRLLVCGVRLSGGAEERPASHQLQRSLLSYLNSPAFKPEVAVEVAALDKLFEGARVPLMQQLGAQVVRVSSEEESRRGRAVIDGDVRTFWRTRWTEGGPKYPHELGIEFPNLVVARGVKITPIQDANGEGRIGEFAIYASRDRLDAGDAPVLTGRFERGTEPLALLFNEPMEVRAMRFVALSAVNPEQPIAALAEIELIAD